jgi:hypothetical protein
MDMRLSILLEPSFIETLLGKTALLGSATFAVTRASERLPSAQ